MSSSQRGACDIPRDDEGAAGAAGPATIWYFQWLRALGALAIVALHVVRECELSEPLMGVAEGLLSTESVLMVLLARWAVPAFFMVSGALMLDPRRQMPTSKVVRHVWRIVFVLLGVGFAFSLMELVYTAGGLDAAMLLEALANVLRGRSWDHLWYLYATLGLYVATPVLRRLLAHLSRCGKEALLLLLWACCCGLPTLALLLPGLLPAARAAECVGWGFPVVYYLAGHLLASASSRGRGSWAALATGLLSLVAMLALSIAGAADAALPEHAFALPFGAAVFVLARRHLDLPGRGGFAWVAVLADYSFGIYLLHPLFAHLLVRVGPLSGASAAAGMAGVLVLQLAIFVLGVLGSMALTSVLRRLPGCADKI